MGELGPAKFAEYFQVSEPSLVGEPGQVVVSRVGESSGIARVSGKHRAVGNINWVTSVG